MLRVKTITTTGQPGGPLLTVTHFQGAADDNTAADAAIQSMRAFWQQLAPFRPVLTVAGVQGEVEIIDPATGNLTGTLGRAADFTPGSGAGGTYLPPATQGLVNLKTAAVVGGRRLHGKIYVGGLHTNCEAGDGQPTPGFLAALDSAADAMIAVAGADPVVWSRAHLISAPVTGRLRFGKFAVLRSRRD